MCVCAHIYIYIKYIKTITVLYCCIIYCNNITVMDISLLVFSTTVEMQMVLRLRKITKNVFIIKTTKTIFFYMN